MKIKEGDLIHCKNEKEFKSLMKQLEDMNYLWISNNKPTKARPMESIQIKYCIFEILPNNRFKYSFLAYYQLHKIPVKEFIKE